MIFTFDYRNEPWKDTPPTPPLDGRCITFKAMAPSTISMDYSEIHRPNIKISYDKIVWTNWNYSTISLDTGKEVYMRGMNTSGFNFYEDEDEDDCSKFVMTGCIECIGNIMHLIDYTQDLTTIPNDYCFYKLFQECTSLTVAPSLPATTLTKGCYMGMFNNCHSLITPPPALPATTLAEDCYFSMFGFCSSLLTTPELPAMTLANHCYQDMFNDCTSLITAPELPATTLAEDCYFAMFSGCTSLTTTPELPAMTLAYGCYSFMFSDCTSLTKAPELKANILEVLCYQGMFYRCSNLNYIKCLATTNIDNTNCGDWVYGVAPTGTFIKESGVNWPTGNDGIPTGWTVQEDVKNYLTFKATQPSTISLTNYGNNEPNLQISTDGNTWHFWDYSEISLNTGDELYMRGLNVNGFGSSSTKYSTFVMTGSIECNGNVMKLIKYTDDITVIPSDYCFYQLFTGCSSLTTAPELPATTLTDYCYGSMFWGCTSLTAAPELPATTLADYCYEEMFYRCTSLTTVPELPATTLANSCYRYMFEYCTSLTAAPELPVTTLADSCYANMFYGCTSLTTAPVLPATTLANSCYNNMFYGCTSLNYVKCLATTNIANNSFRWLYNVSPTGTFVKSAGATWTTGTSGIPTGWTIQEDFKNYLTFKANANSTIALNNVGGNAPNLQISTDGNTWTNWNYSAISLNQGDELYMRGLNVNGFNFPGMRSNFVMTGSIECRGSIMKLIEYTQNLTTIPSNNCFYTLFTDCTSLTTAPELPATTLTPNCYEQMFYGCTSLTAAPALPATTLTYGCYQNMFTGCTSLTTAPALPATTLNFYCYSGMFSGCTSLVNAPALPAMEIKHRCYYAMFSRCTSLVNAPELPATTLDNQCYEQMFNGCTSLNYVKCLATSGNTSTNCNIWLQNVSPTGTFVKSAGVSWTTGTSGIPSGWTVINA